ncbi:P-loop containing nucleoside triphosphate hydrolase protein [Jackrogersella minutella]|nr:P-loop containing nucleoside triphosphate hydrolase protein [Jackrogersella minutella]
MARREVLKSQRWKDLVDENIKKDGEDCTTKGRLDSRQIFKTMARTKKFYSDHPVNPARITDGHNFAKFAIEEALEEYSPSTNFQITGGIMQGQFVSMGVDRREIPKELSDAILADSHHEVDAEEPNSPREDQEIVQDVGGAAQALLAASPNSLGPPIDACASYLRMKKCGEFGRNRMTVWSSPLFPTLDGRDGRKGFLDNQVTAIVWIMSRFLGVLPPLKLKTKENWDPQSRRYIQKPETPLEMKNRKLLRGPRYSGAILADSMGLGKTLITIACLDILSSQRLNVPKEGGEARYRPMLILVPNTIVATQWVEEIEQIGGDRAFQTIIVSSDGIPKKPRQERVHSVSSGEFEKWPNSLSYVWDEDNVAASRAVMVISIDAWSRRTCKITSEKADEGEQKKVLKLFSTFASMGRRFSIVVVDEAYKIKNPRTQYYKSVAMLHRQYTLLITATPCMNVLTDLLGPAGLLWQGAEKYLKGNPKEWQKIDWKFSSQHDLASLDKLPSWHDHQLVAGRPSLLMKLFPRHRNAKPIDIQKTRSLLKYFESLAILRRAPSSYLYSDWDHTKPVSLEGLLPRVENFTVNIQRDHALETAYQEMHSDLLIRYLEIVQKWRDKNTVKSDYSSITQLYVQLELAAASIDVFRLDKIFSSNGFGAKAGHVRQMREANVHFMRIAPFLLEPSDSKPKIAVDYVKLAVRRSPILRYILQFVKDNVLHKGPNGKIKKLLITESRPILAYYYELVLQFLLIHCRTLHAGLSGDQRRELIASFNDDADDSCQILIQMYSVGFAGSNLHKNCAQVLVASQAHSLAVQWQAVHRVIRVGQESDVNVYRLKVNNSYHAYRESRQVEKILPELGTRSQGRMNSVLVQLLNLFQSEVDDAWNSPEGQKLLEDRNLLTDPIPRNDDDDDEPSPKRIKTKDDIPDETGKSDHDSGDSEGEEPEEEGSVAEESSSDSDSRTLRKRKRDDNQSPTDPGTASLFDDNHREFLELKPRNAYYTEFKTFPKKVKGLFCHDKNNLRRLLSYGSPNGNATTREWTSSDLDNSAVLERAMELMLRIRLGTNHIEMLPLPLIDFSLVGMDKREYLTSLLGMVDATPQEIEDAYRAAMSRSRSKGDSNSIVKEITDDMKLSDIDAALEADITKVDSKSTRQLKRREDQQAASVVEEEEEYDDDDDDNDNEGEEGDEEEYEEEEEAGGLNDYGGGDDDTGSRVIFEASATKVKLEDRVAVVPGDVQEATKVENGEDYT